MKTASSIVSAVVKSHMIPEIETIIDEEKQVTHRKIADKIEKLFVNPELISKAVCVTRIPRDCSLIMFIVTAVEARGCRLVLYPRDSEWWHLRPHRS